MISKMSHVCIYVINQDSAYEFYTKKLGFKVVTDAPMGNGSRWLTVCPPDQPELEVTLYHLNETSMQSKETADVMIDLVKKGTFGAGVFTCKDLLATYEELKAKGVVFKKPPTKEFYGYEALFVDDSGNWFSLGEIEKK